MNKLILLAIAVVVGLLLLVQWLPGSGYLGSKETYTELARGSFALAQGGSLLGEEHYTLGRSPQGNLRLTSQVELTFQGVKLAMTQELRLAPDLRALLYRLKADTPQGKQEIEVRFTDEQAKLSVRGGGLHLKKEFTNPEGFIVLDNNLPSHLLIVYELIRSKEEFKAIALVPQALMAMPLKSSRAGSVRLTPPGGEPPSELVAERFSLWLGDLQFELYAAEGELVGGKFPGEVLIYRADRFPRGFAVVEDREEGPPIGRPPPEVSEEEVSFTSPDGLKLAGSLTLPEGATGLSAVPAVLMIAGSGPVDRDENAPGLRIDFFKAVAYALARAGIGSLRYDKRGVGRSEGQFRRVSLSDLIGDARTALEYLQARPEVDSQRVFLLGHSEGGVIAPILAAANGGEKVAGLVLIAATAHPLDWILLKQTELIGRALGLTKEAIEKDLDRLRRFIAFVKASEGDWEDYTLEEVRRWLPGLTSLEFEAYKAISLRWYREHFAHDPLRTIRQVQIPVLIIHGEKDLQVPPEEARLLFQALQEAGNKAVELHLLPDLNHLMRYHPEGPTIAYLHLDEPVDERVLRIILDWVGAHRG